MYELIVNHSFYVLLFIISVYLFINFYNLHVAVLCKKKYSSLKVLSTTIINLGTCVVIYFTSYVMYHKVTLKDYKLYNQYYDVFHKQLYETIISLHQYVMILYIVIIGAICIYLVLNRAAIITFENEENALQNTSRRSTFIASCEDIASFIDTPSKFSKTVNILLSIVNIVYSVVVLKQLIQSLTTFEIIAKLLQRDIFLHLFIVTLQALYALSHCIGIIYSM